jgi:hypothetical protein
MRSRTDVSSRLILVRIHLICPRKMWTKAFRRRRGMFELSDERVPQIALRYRAGGLEAAVWERTRHGKQRALDKSQQQKVVALACGPPTLGQARWTVRVLAAS